MAKDSIYFEKPVCSI